MSNILVSASLHLKYSKDQSYAQLVIATEKKYLLDGAPAVSTESSNNICYVSLTNKNNFRTDMHCVMSDVARGYFTSSLGIIPNYNVLYQYLKDEKFDTLHMLRTDTEHVGEFKMSVQDVDILRANVWPNSQPRLDIAEDTRYTDFVTKYLSLRPVE